MTYIYNKARFEQASLRKGIEHLNIQSTDIDTYCDMGGKLKVFVEFKTLGSTMGKGQEMAARSLLRGDDVPSVFLVASHDTTPDEEIAPNAYVTKALWKMPGQPIKSKEYGWDERFVHPSEIMSVDEALCTLALIACPRLLKPVPSWYLEDDEMLDDMLGYFHPEIT